MSNSKDSRANTETLPKLPPIVGLTEDLPKELLEPIVVEAIHKHRYLRDVAELRHAESRPRRGRTEVSEQARSAYIRAMIDVHAQQTVLSTLLDVLGYVPKVPAA